MKMGALFKVKWSENEHKSQFLTQMKVINAKMSIVLYPY